MAVQPSPKKFSAESIGQCLRLKLSAPKSGDSLRLRQRFLQLPRKFAIFEAKMRDILLANSNSLCGEI